MSMSRVPLDIAEREESERQSTAPTRDWPKMEKEAFTGLPGEIVRMIEPHTESDSVAILMNVLCFFGNCIGRGPHYRVEGTRHGTNLYVLQIGDSAKARKGTAADRVKQLFSYADEEWGRLRFDSGLATGEGMIWRVRDPITKMVRDGKGADAQMVEEEVDHGVEDKRLMVVESEFARVLKVIQREGNTLSSILRDAWDRGNIASMTKTNPARATGAHVSVIGHITGSEYRVCLDKTEMANGFANRFLMLCIRRSKLLPFGGDLSDDSIIAMGQTIAGAVERARGIGHVYMDPEARNIWQAIYADLSSARPGLLGALTARAEAQTVRLAMLYALWDGTPIITAKHLSAAGAVWDYCQASVEYVFGDALGDPVADTILSALKHAGGDGLTRTAISALFSRNAESLQIGRALEELDRHRLAVKVKPPVSPSGGRPPEVWVYVRR